jgi:hypothetical protein
MLSEVGEGDNEDSEDEGVGSVGVLSGDRSDGGDKFA